MLDGGVQKGSLGSWRSNSVPRNTTPRETPTGVNQCPVCGKRCGKGAFLLSSTCNETAMGILRAPGSQEDNLWNLARKCPAFAGKTWDEAIRMIGAYRHQT